MNWEEFLKLLEDKGCTVNNGPLITHHWSNANEVWLEEEDSLYSNRPHFTKQQIERARVSTDGTYLHVECWEVDQELYQHRRHFSLRFFDIQPFNLKQL